SGTISGAFHDQEAGRQARPQGRGPEDAPGRFRPQPRWPLWWFAQGARSKGPGPGIQAAASRALAEMDKDQGSLSDPHTAPQDPRGKYPKPPFKKQKQPWPGLACKMEPP